MFSTNYLFKDKGVRERCPKNKQEGIKTRCPENKQLEATNYLTPKIHDDQQPSADDHHRYSLRDFSSKGLKDKGFNKSPYTDSLNNSHRSLSKRSNKRALLCGVTYNIGRKYKLKGTVNDVINMKDLLMTRFGYPAESIRVMTEYEEGGFIPTKQNIKNSLKWLVEGCEAGDSLVFYFSGHGFRQPDFKDDERDGFDETICPVDFLLAGMIFDNEINNDIVKPLKKGVTLHAIVDACQTGTILDLNHVYNHREGVWTDNSPPSGVPKGTSGGLAICLCAYNDDTSAFGRKMMSGAMTFILFRALKESPDITYMGLLQKMSDAIDQVNADRCLKPKIFKKMFCQNINQAERTKERFKQVFISLVMFVTFVFLATHCIIFVKDSVSK